MLINHEQNIMVLLHILHSYIFKSTGSTPRCAALWRDRTEDGRVLWVVKERNDWFSQVL